MPVDYLTTPAFEPYPFVSLTEADAAAFVGRVRAPFIQRQLIMPAFRLPVKQKANLKLLRNDGAALGGDACVRSRRAMLAA